MRTQTAREKAEALVALIRQEFPSPKRMDDDLYSSEEWYCVGVAACEYHCNHNLPDADFWECAKKSITIPNDEGDFTKAWLALTDCYEDKFAKEQVT